MSAKAKSAKTAKSVGVTKSNEVATIEVSRIFQDEGQPRKEFKEETIASMAQSLERFGQLQPINVRWDEQSSRWIIISGERRWRAAKSIGMESLLCRIWTGTILPENLRLIQITENFEREDLSAIDQAKAFKELMDEFGYSQAQLSEQLRIDRTSINKTLALLPLPEEVKEMVDTGALPASTAYELTKGLTPEAQVEVAREVIDKDLSRQETVAEVAKAKARGGASAKPSAGSRTSSPKKKRPILHNNRIFNHSGIKVTVITNAKAGFTLIKMLEALKHAMEMVEAEIEVDERLGTLA